MFILMYNFFSLEFPFKITQKRTTTESYICTGQNHKFHHHHATLISTSSYIKVKVVKPAMSSNKRTQQTIRHLSLRWSLTHMQLLCTSVLRTDGADWQTVKWKRAGVLQLWNELSTVPTMSNPNAEMCRKLVNKSCYIPFDVSFDMSVHTY